MNKKKLNLNELNIESFVTLLVKPESKTIQGGKIVFESARTCQPHYECATVALPNGIAV